MKRPEVIETKKSYCRFCHAFCAIEVDVESDQVVAVRGDSEDPLYHGYTCLKGRALPEQHNSPHRLRSSMKREPDGTFQPIGSEQAMDEIAARLGEIVERHGPRSVACWAGFQGGIHAMQLAKAWIDGIGSPFLFSALTLDQTGKIIAKSLHGDWGGGGQPFDGADVWMLVGCNPLVSMWGGIPYLSPSERLRKAQARGLKLIVVDPRRTETAKRADLFLQIRPGEDPTLLAGIARILLEERLYDADFCAANVIGLDELRAAVHDFTLDHVEARTGIPAADVERAARWFAALPKGRISSGTGPDWAGHGNLTEYLIAAINSLGGRYLREGELVPNPGVFRPPTPYRAQPIAVPAPWGEGAKSRIRGLGQFLGEMPVNVFTGEVLTPGAGQIKALVVCAADPIVSAPDQLEMIRAFETLELVVTVDYRISATARRSHYVIAPKLSLERADITDASEWSAELYGQGGFPEPYARYTPPMISTTFDVLEEWEFFWGLAHRMRVPMILNGASLDLDRKPTAEGILRTMTEGSRIPLDDVKKFSGGRIFGDRSVRVEPRDPACTVHLNLGHPLMMEDLRVVRAEPVVTPAGSGPAKEFTHRLISIRMRNAYNAYGHDQPSLVKKHSYNPAFMSPSDVEALGLRSGDRIEISSRHASIPAIVEASEDVPQGVVGMAHSWGDGPDDDHRVREIGSTTNRLIPVDRDYEPIAGVPRMSAIPVNVRPAFGR